MAKAERKRTRELERMERASDPFSPSKGGKKGRKNMLRAASLAPSSSTVSPNRVIDITTLIAQIRRFVTMLDGPHEMKLPPCDKQTRVLVHELASVFDLKSVSKGVGEGRYTTLIKTSRTKSVGYNLGKKGEGKIGAIVRRSGASANGGSAYEFVKKKQGGGGGGGGGMDRGKIRPKEGEIVGKVCLLHVPGYLCSHLPLCSGCSQD